MSNIMFSETPTLNKVAVFEVILVTYVHFVRRNRIRHEEIRRDGMTPTNVY